MDGFILFFHNKCHAVCQQCFVSWHFDMLFLPIYNLNQKSALVDRQSSIWNLNTNKFAIQVSLLLLQPLIQFQFRNGNVFFFSINQSQLLGEIDSFRIGMIQEHLNQKQYVLHAVTELALDQLYQVDKTTGCSIGNCNF